MMSATEVFKHSDQFLNRETEVIKLSLADLKKLKKSIVAKDLADSHHRVLMEVSKIENRFHKILAKFLEIESNILAEKERRISQKELELIKNNICNENNPITAMEAQIQGLEQQIISIRAEQLSHIAKEQDIYLNRDFEKKYPEAAAFLKVEIIKSVYKDFFKKEYFVAREYIVEKIQNSDFEGFAYFSTNPIELIKVSKISDIADQNGKVLASQEIFQTYSHFMKKMVYNNTPVVIRCNLYYGIISCRKSDSGKIPIMYNQILEDAEKRAKKVKHVQKTEPVSGYPKDYFESIQKSLIHQE